MTDQDGDMEMGGVRRDDIQAAYQITGTTNESRQFLDEMEIKRQGSLIAVPTYDEDVRKKLRELAEPITYFGEDKGDRRDRLRRLLVTKKNEGMDVDAFLRGMHTSTSAADEEEEEEEEEEEYWTQGEIELKQARKFIKRYSMEHASKRLQQQKYEAQQSLQLHVKNRRQVFERMCRFDALGTQTGFNRPVSATKVSADSKYVAAADWSGAVNLFALPNLDPVRSYQGHSGKVGGLAWNPSASSENTLNLVSGGLEGDVNLWSLDRNEPLASCSGHEGQVAKVDVHPSGKYIGSASHDYTWRLWDAETQQELLCQEGHSKEVVAFKFQCDGSLAASAGMDAIGRVWDLRTGKTIMLLTGHIRAIHSLDFSPNGYQLATASADNSVLIWDIRQNKSIATIPAHTNLVSDVRYYQGVERSFEGLTEAGTFLATSSYDKTIKIWSADNWVLKHTMHDSNKVMSIDIASDQKGIVSGRWDRYIKLWTDPETAI